MSQRHKQLVGLSGLLLLAFGLRMFRIESQSIWWDEGISLDLATSPLPHIILNRAANIHPPLYFILLKGWVALTGTTSFAARSSAAFLSLLQVPVAYAVTKRWFRSERVGWLTAVFITLSPLSIIYAQEIRVYAILPLLFFGLIGLTSQLLNKEQTPGWRQFGLLALLMWLGIHLHYVAAFMVAYVGLWGAITFARRQNWGAFRRLVWTGMGVIVASLPWATAVLLSTNSVQGRVARGTYLSESVPTDFLLQQIWTFHLTGLAGAVGNETIRQVSLLIGLAVLLLLATGWLFSKRRRASAQWLLHWLLPLGLALGLWSIRSFSHPRYVSMFAFGIFPLFSAAISNVPSSEKKPLRWFTLGVGGLLATAVIAISIWSIDTYFFSPTAAKADMKGVAAYLEQNATAVDLILLPDAGDALRFEYEGAAQIVMPDIDHPDLFWQNVARWTEQPRTLYRVIDENDVSANLGVLPFALESSGWLVERRHFEGLIVDKYMLEKPVQKPSLTPLDGRFGNVTLSGAWIEQNAAADTAVTLALSMYSNNDPRRFYISLRLVDQNGIQLGQQDDLLLDTLGRPSDQWPQRAPTTTYHRLPLLVGTPPGTYTVQASIYHLSENGVETVGLTNQPGQELLLGEVVIGAKVGVENPYQLTNRLPPLDSPITFSNALTLEAAGIDRDEIAPGQTLMIALLWRAENNELTNTEPKISLLQNEKALETTVVSPSYPINQWQKGERVLTHQFITIPQEAVGEAQVQVHIGGSGVTIANITITDLARQFEPPDFETAVDQTLGDVARLLGYTLTENQISGNGTITIDLVWEALTEQETNYTVFVHLLDEDGRVIGQHDSPPLFGSRPTAGWISGEYLLDPHPITLNENATSGPATIAIGLYDPATSIRLTTPEGTNFIPLHEMIQVELGDE